MAAIATAAAAADVLDEVPLELEGVEFAGGELMLFVVLIGANEATGVATCGRCSGEGGLPPAVACT